MKRLLAPFAVLSVSALFAAMEPATPESQGVPSTAVLDFIAGLERTFPGTNDTGNVHGFVIVRHGKVIAEGSWTPFDTLNETHMLYSHSKSFTSTAVGFLADDGKLDLDERLVDLFPEYAPANPSENLRQLRIRDLLAMNVGANRTDPQGYDKGGVWAAAFMTNVLERAPGSGFRYDSSATYMCAAIVEKKSGKRLMDFLRERLFDKIGIRQDAWTTTSPQGIACGGWGMNMTTRDIARFGQFYLQKGKWNGEQILSRQWIELATARQTWSGHLGPLAGSDSCQGYGYQFWLNEPGGYRADGAAGQYTVVLPDQDLVVSTHAAVHKMPLILKEIWKHLLPALKDRPLAEDAAAQAALRIRLETLVIAPVKGCDADGAFAGRWIRFAENSRGLESVRFDKAEKGWTCSLKTRAGTSVFPIGCGEWLSGSVAIDPEPYESLGALIGVQPTKASGGVKPDGSFAAQVFLTGTTASLRFAVAPDGSLSGILNCMRGCLLSQKP